MTSRSEANEQLVEIVARSLCWKAQFESSYADTPSASALVFIAANWPLHAPTAQAVLSALSDAGRLIVDAEVMATLARQKLPDEMDEHERGGADWELGYEILVSSIRAMIAASEESDGSPPKPPLKGVGIP